MMSCVDTPTSPGSSMRPEHGPNLSAAAGPKVVISQVYGAGGNAGAVLKSDYVELFNAGGAPAVLDGWSVQYASTTSSTATTSFGSATAISGTLAPGQYYLIKMADGAVGAALPTADATGAIAMAAGAGKVALVDQVASLGCNTAANCTAAQLTHLIDLVGYGTGTNYFEGAGPTATISATTAAFRAGNGCTDTGNNAADFAVAAPAPRNTSTPLAPCAGGGGGPVIGPLEHIVLSGGSSAAVGATVVLSAQMQDASNQNITDASATYAWTSANDAIASVASTSANTATIKGISVGGPVAITATVTSGGVTKTVSTNVTVNGSTIVPSTVTVSEIHYDNAGTDQGESIEIEGDAGTSLEGWSVVLYNGNGGVPYDTRTLTGTIPATCGARGVVVVTYPQDAIQNGSPDGWALVNALGQPVEFKSYEGTFAATTGPAAGLTSVALNADETTAPAVGQSVQRAGNGVWFGPRANTFGTCNAPTPPPRQGSLSVTSGKASIALGMQTQYFFSGVDSTGATVSSVVWSTSNASIISVDQNGVVTGKGVGTAQLTATAPDGAFGTVDMTVYNAAGSSSIRVGHNTEFGEPRDADPSDDFIIRRTQYTVSYNPRRGGANWVSWNLDASHNGDNGRCPGTCYSADTALTKAGLTAYTTADWVSNVNGVTGYDRGHMAPSADWTSSEADNNTTFFLSNFLPQRADLNQGPWEVLESALRDSVSAANGSREAYIIAGGIFTNGVGLGSLRDLGKIWIPDSTYKIAIITPAGTGLKADGSLPAGTTVLVVNMPNVQGIRGVDWTTYITTIAKVEKSTGYNFLALMAESVQCRVEVRNCAPTAHISGSGVAGGVEGQTLSFDASTSVDPDAGNTLSYMWTLDGQNVGIQPAYTRTFADNGTFNLRLIVSDQFGGADTTITAVSVLNVAPSVAALPNASFNKGGTYTASGSFTDPGDDSWSATVDYGDASGVQPLTLSGKTFSLSHVYAVPGSYVVKVTVREGDAESAVGVQTATVIATNAAPVIGALNAAALLRGEPYLAGDNFVDADADTWTATVNYGDGTPTSALPLIGKNFGLLHAYRSVGTFTITVSVSDGFVTSTRTAIMTVTSAAQGLDELGAKVAALPGLNKGQLNSLQVKLDNAAKKLDQSNEKAASNEIGAFIDELNADMKSGKVTVADGLPIAVYAGRVIVSINAP